ncbi:MAG: glycosyltransferase [Isosphaeraceae bacterium]
MRIGIDMLAVQSPGSRGRGVGRYGVNLVSAMMARDDAHEYVLYAHDGYPIESIPVSPKATLSFLRPELEWGESKLRDAIERVARTNPHDLDALLVLNPFELCAWYDPPAKPLNGLATAAVIYDLIPFLFQETYLADPQNAAWFYRRLKTIRNYDALLTISGATRADCLRLLDLPTSQVVTIGGASDGTFFTPDRSFPMSAKTRATLHAFGIRGSYVFCLAGLDDRKNLRGLMDAFRHLPTSVRRSHQLVVTCYLNEEAERRTRQLAEDWGLAENLILTGEVSDEALRVLYQRCAAFAFPSLYEGLGLPLLEAMHCGATVIAGNNSSQIEVVGDAGLIANASDPSDIAAKLCLALECPQTARMLGNRAIERAGRFTWDRTAEQTLGTLQRLVKPSVLARRRAAPKPYLAVVSPWPPKGSGIADYAARLVGELKHAYEIDLYHEPGYVPEMSLKCAGFACHDVRLFRRNASLRPYRGVLYQMGNSYYHGFLYEMMAQYPGIVTLHDFNLAAFQFWRAHQGGVPIDNFRFEIEHNYPDRIGEIVGQLWDWTKERGGLQEACARRGLHLNRRVFEWSEAVVVHSPWCLEQVQETYPHLAAKTAVAPMGVTMCSVSREHRAEVRKRFGLPLDALVFASYGILSQGKMNVEAIEAFGALVDDYPLALLIFVGQDWENGEAKSKVEALGLESRVRFLGRQSDTDFQALIAVADVGIALRRPPTYGETSAALLDLLAHGVPTVITDVATFSSYPSTVVRKVRWPDEGIEGLARVLRNLAGDPHGREALGRAASDYVSAHHAWTKSAEKYIEVIEQCHLQRIRNKSLAG